MKCKRNFSPVTGNEIYQRIIFLIKNRNIKRDVFYLETGLSRQTIAKWKKGNLPGSEAVIKISEYLHVSTDFLLTGSEKYTSNCSEQSVTILELLNNVDNKLTEIKKILI